LSKKLISDNERGQTSLLDHFDCVIWAGDLNYRVSLTRQAADEYLERGEHLELLKYDQLSLAMHQKDAFLGFAEAPINFQPTYKYDRNSDIFDTSPKQRVPSFTDRILFKTAEYVQVLEYSSIQNMRTSDHRPVYASFLVKIRPPSDETRGGQVGKGENFGQNTSQVCSIM